MTHWLIGLGNPGSRYADTRHNAGFWLVDAVAETAGARWRSAWFRPFYWARVQCGVDSLILLKSKHFMNVSSRAFQRLWMKGSLDPLRTLVIFDQMDLPPGSLRLKRSGSSGGHNGLKSLDTLWNGGYARLAVGIGRPSGNSVVEHVLGVPSAWEARLVRESVLLAASLIAREWTAGWEALIHGINSIGPAPQNPGEGSLSR